MTEASTHIFDLTERLRDHEKSLTESRPRENKLLRDLEENKRRYRDTKHEVTHLKGTRVKQDTSFLVFCLKKLLQINRLKTV